MPSKLMLIGSPLKRGGADDKIGSVPLRVCGTVGPDEATSLSRRAAFCAGVSSMLSARSAAFGIGRASGIRLGGWAQLCRKTKAATVAVRASDLSFLVGFFIR